jgi:5-methylcytosine-specific restriction endonuclease McrA
MSSQVTLEKRRLYKQRYKAKNPERYHALKKKHNKQYRESHKEEFNAKRRHAWEYDPVARAKKIESDKKWVVNNREKSSAVKKRWQDKYPDHHKDYYQQNKGKFQAWYQQNYAVNKQQYIHRARLRRVRLLNSEGTFTEQDWLQLKEIYNHTCPRCFRQEPEIKLTVDHKVPLTKGGTNYIDNIQPLCFSCNSSKSTNIWFASYPINYMKDVFATIPR